VDKVLAVEDPPEARQTGGLVAAIRELNRKLARREHPTASKQAMRRQVQYQRLLSSSLVGVEAVLEVVAAAAIAGGAGPTLKLMHQCRFSDVR
jgi:hypothetical protein